MNKKKTVSVIGKKPAQDQKQPPKNTTVKDTTVKESDFEIFEEWNAFQLFTKSILMKKIPKMPFKSLGDYLKYYNLISEKKDGLTGTQRILVKNVIHAEMRKGTITLVKK